MTSTGVNNVPSPLNGYQLDLLEKAKASSISNLSNRRPLRIAIVTENFLPKIDGVTRTLARLLEHLQLEGHTALVLGPESGMDSYAGHEVLSTKGIPLLGIYKGLKLNFLRPMFIRRLMEFKPDVIQFVDPIWLCAQTIPAVQYYLPDTPLLCSYHTNLAQYATLFGFSWLTPVMWALQKNLHSRCSLTFCPSPSTARMLTEHQFENVRLWPRGADTCLFRREARDFSLRQSWSAELIDDSSRRSSLDSSPPPYSTHSETRTESSKVVLLYVGRISWEKNLRLLVEAARGLEVASKDGRRPACQLVFVGDGPSRVELEALCASYGLGAIFMGYRKGEELAAAYASADIFAFPSWTETFGQVVLESLSSGLPVVGLRAEGVVDLVKHKETGLLLDMDDLLPSTSAASIKSSTPPAPADPSAFKPLPQNPHALISSSSPTFPLAVSLYRGMLETLATDHELRLRMGRAAAKDASKRSWHGAMEMLVDGYREIARPIATPPASAPLSRTSTLEVVSHLADSDTYAESTAASPRTKRRGVGRVLRLGSSFRRTGTKAKEGSISSIQPLRWLAPRSIAALDTSTSEGIVFEKGGLDSVWVLRWLFRAALFAYFMYTILGLMTDTSSTPFRSLYTATETF